MKGIGNVLLAVLDAGLRLLVAFIDGLFGTDLEAAWDNLWKSIGDLLSSFDFVAKGREWVDGLLKGIQDAWERLFQWVQRSAKELLPEWIVNLVAGDDEPGSTSSPPPPGLPPPPSPSLFAPPQTTLFDQLRQGRGDGAAPGGPRPGAKVALEFKNLPPGTRIGPVERTSPDVDVDIDAGFAFGDVGA